VRIADCGLRIADFGLNAGGRRALSSNPQSEIRNPKSAEPQTVP
jgi:hypothetical protein